MRARECLPSFGIIERDGWVFRLDSSQLSNQSIHTFVNLGSKVASPVVSEVQRYCLTSLCATSASGGAGGSEYHSRQFTSCLELIRPNDRVPVPFPSCEKMKEKN